MKRIYMLRGLVIVGIVLTLFVNYLATAGVLNGVTPPEISDALLTKFTPANYAFAIWSIIYTFVIGFAIYQALPSQRDNPTLEGVRELFIASCALNILWTFAWHYEFYFLSLVFMVGILLTMIGIFMRAGIGKPAASWGERLWVHLPFSLYLAWIAVATIANAASLLVYYDWSAFGINDSLWSAIMIMIAAIIGAAVLWKRANAAYAAVYVWAVIAITVRYANDTPSTSPPTPVSSSSSPPLFWDGTALSKIEAINLRNLSKGPRGGTEWLWWAAPKHLLTAGKTLNLLRRTMC